MNFYKTHTSFFTVVLAKIAGALPPLVLAWLFSVKLPVESYGGFQSVVLFTSVLAVTGTFGIGTVLLNKSFNPLFAKSKKLLYTTVSLLLAAQLAGALYLYFSKAFSQSGVFYSVLAIIFFQSLNIIFETIFLSLLKQKTVLWINIAYAFLFLAWHIYILNTDYDLYKIVLGVAILSAVKACVYYFITPILKQTNTMEINPKQYCREWLLLGANEVLGIWAKWIDKSVIFFLFATADFAYYFNGAYEIPFFGMLVSAAGGILIVSFSNKENSLEKNIEHFKQTTLLLSSIVFPAFALLLLYHQEFFTVLFKAKFNQSIPIFLVSICILPLRICYSTAFLQTMNRAKEILVGSVIDIVCFIALCSVLYPVGGKLMIPLALVISTYIQVSYYLYKTSKLLNKPVQKFFPVYWLLIKLFAAVVITAAAYYLIPLENYWVKLIVGIVITCGIMFLLLFYDAKKADKAPHITLL